MIKVSCFVYFQSLLSEFDFEDYMNGWLVGFYGISTFVGYLMPNPFLCK